jgi:hypothetical protein
MKVNKLPILMLAHTSLPLLSLLPSQFRLGGLKQIIISTPLYPVVFSD